VVHPLNSSDALPILRRAGRQEERCLSEASGPHRRRAWNMCRNLLDGNAVGYGDVLPAPCLHPESQSTASAALSGVQKATLPRSRIGLT
jgi:hypothetical protein